MNLLKSLLTVMGATMLLGALVSNGSARNFSTSSQTMRATFQALTFEASGTRIACGPLTLEGSLHSRTIAKVAESLIGYITGATICVCASFAVTLLRETLPWHIRYAGFGGVLPNITRMETHVIGFAFRFRDALFVLLGTSTTANPLIVRFDREISSRSLTTASIEGAIPAEGPVFHFSSSSGPLTVLNSTSRITVTLI